MAHIDQGPNFSVVRITKAPGFKDFENVPQSVNLYRTVDGSYTLVDPRGFVAPVDKDTGIEILLGGFVGTKPNEPVVWVTEGSRTKPIRESMLAYHGKDSDSAIVGDILIPRDSQDVAKYVFLGKVNLSYFDSVKIVNGKLHVISSSNRDYKLYECTYVDGTRRLTPWIRNEYNVVGNVGDVQAYMKTLPTTGEGFVIDDGRTIHFSHQGVMSENDSYEPDVLYIPDYQNTSYQRFWKFLEASKELKNGRKINKFKIELI